VLVLPTAAAATSGEEGDKTSGLTLFQLTHPRTKDEALYAVSGRKDSGLYEVATLDEDMGSWAFGPDRISGHSRMNMIVPTDPLFLVIPLLKSTSAKVPLDHLISDKVPQSQVQYYDHLIPTFVKRLAKVADQVGSPDLNVWKWNEEKTMTFLSQKCRKLASKLASTEIKTDGNSSDIMAKASTDADRLRLAWQIVSESLEPELANLLKAKLEISDVGDTEATAASSSSAKTPLRNSGKSASTSETAAADEKLAEINDYSNYGQQFKAKAHPKLTAKQKALAKASTGTKGIGAFFAKK